MLRLSNTDEPLAKPKQLAASLLSDAPAMIQLAREMTRVLQSEQNIRPVPEISLGR